MEYDNYIIMDNDKELKIYPMAEFNVKNEKIIIYVSEIKNEYSKDDFYVGQEIGDKILPVKDSLLKDIQKIFEELVKKILESKGDN